MNRPIYITEIKKIIMSSKGGSVFVASDFTDIASKKTASMGLLRLEEDGLIKRVLRGVYFKPEYNEFLAEYVAPNPDDVANALARNYGWTIVPCGDTALNMLGLSTQVPAVWSYVSDGPYKEYSYDNTIIKLNHTNNKDISKCSYKTAIVIQALKAIGKENIDDATLNKLSETLTEKEKRLMLTESKAATSWIYEYIRMLCTARVETCTNNYTKTDCLL